MRAKVAQINWHDQQPVFSVDFDPLCLNRFATCGGDSTVRLWKVEQGEMEYLTSLTRHTNGVNCVRFAPNSSILASGGDGIKILTALDGSIIIWKQSIEEASHMVVDDDSKEHWKLIAFLRGSNQEIYDICWSPDGKLLAAGGVDGSVRIFDAGNEHKVLHVVAEHSRFVQGIAWDPLFEFIATQSNDRSVNIYNYTQDSIKTTPKLFTKHVKMMVDEKAVRLYHDEDINSFFRRLAFSPDGSFLITVAGIAPGSVLENTAYVYVRGGIRGSPFAHLPGHKKPIVAIRFSPIKYHLGTEKKDESDLTNLNYRYIFAVATLDSVVIYDTQTMHPLAFLGNLHYSFLSDVAWSADGRILIISSQDGFCTYVEFEDGELGRSIEGVPTSLGHELVNELQSTIKPIQVLKGSFIKKKTQTKVNVLGANLIKTSE